MTQDVKVETVYPYRPGQNFTVWRQELERELLATDPPLLGFLHVENYNGSQTYQYNGKTMSPANTKRKYVLLDEEGTDASSSESESNDTSSSSDSDSPPRKQRKVDEGSSTQEGEETEPPRQHPKRKNKNKNKKKTRKMKKKHVPYPWKEIKVTQ